MGCELERCAAQMQKGDYMVNIRSHVSLVL
jgi:hypothetical protein